MSFIRYIERMRQHIEIFHILFCKSLLTTVDKSLIVLKGGCNLRFFFGSNRYSEDIDFDVETIAAGTLRKRVDKILGSQTFRSILSAKNIELASFSAPKQTETVQRWKLAIRCQGIDTPSKIEFSRRGIDRNGTAFDSLDPIFLGQYSITPTFMTHYNVTYAVKQKIAALAGRSETQARDIYDLHLLMSRAPATQIDISKEILVKSIEAAMSIDRDQFLGQVVEFLTADARDFYSAPKVWEDLQAKITTMLEKNL